LGELAEHPEEVMATAALLYRQWRVTGAVGSGSTDSEDANEVDPKEKWCYWMLNKVSRSFALVISELGPEMRKAIMVFYLVLRGLDTVEDDKNFPKERKLPLLLGFHEVLEQRGWHLTGCGANRHERSLMENFYLVIDQYLSLKKGYREVIKDITRRMGAGMARFFTDDTAHRVETLQDWDNYCHYVAGLVGIGLSDLFASSTLEDRALSSEHGHQLSNTMGLFLQKTNIISDYH
jgi:farnesyl-diphosphate farnesyltransferase